MGRVDDAARFKHGQRIPFPLLVDRKKNTYRALEAASSVAGALGPRVWLKGAKAVLTGHGMAPARQDWRQLGATAVVAPGGEVVYLHRSKNASDNPPVDDLLRELR